MNVTGFIVFVLCIGLMETCLTIGYAFGAPLAMWA